MFELAVDFEPDDFEPDDFEPDVADFEGAFFDSFGVTFCDWEESPEEREGADEPDGAGFGTAIEEEGVEDDAPEGRSEGVTDGEAVCECVGAEEPVFPGAGEAPSDEGLDEPLGDAEFDDVELEEEELVDELVDDAEGVEDIDDVDELVEGFADATCGVLLSLFARSTATATAPAMAAPARKVVASVAALITPVPSLPFVS